MPRPSGDAVLVCAKTALVLYIVAMVLLTLQVFGLFSIHLPQHRLHNAVLGSGSDASVVRTQAPGPQG